MDEDDALDSVWHGFWASATGDHIDGFVFDGFSEDDLGTVGEPVAKSPPSPPLQYNSPVYRPPAYFGFCGSGESKAWAPVPTQAPPPSPEIYQGCFQRYAGSSSKSDSDFSAVLHDPTVVMNPQELGFIPTVCWPNQNVSFGALVQAFFHKRSNVNCRFYHKLFDALRISTYFPNIRAFIGVTWVTSSVIRVDGPVFARLLKVNKFQAGLFHNGGNFACHGFVELNAFRARSLLGPENTAGVDFQDVRLYEHADGLFTRDSLGINLEDCHWITSRIRDSIAACACRNG
jgi:hypothetical protein